MGKQVKICYLPQTPEFEEGTTVLRAAIADNVNELNQWTIEADARSMLNQLGFYDYDEKSRAYVRRTEEEDCTGQCTADTG